MDYLFDNCQTLKNLDISNFDIKDKTNIDYMFSGCSDNLKDDIRNKNKGIKEKAFKDRNKS